jgi:hypothetical protein
VAIKRLAEEMRKFAEVVKRLNQKDAYGLAGTAIVAGIAIMWAFGNKDFNKNPFDVNL